MVEPLFYWGWSRLGVKRNTNFMSTFKQWLFEVEGRIVWHGGEEDWEAFCQVL